MNNTNCNLPINVAIAIFAHKRPSHLERVLEALSRNTFASELPVYIYIDGPRSTPEQKDVERVSQVARAASGFKETIIRESSQNKGLYLSLTSGISEVLETFESIIVLEDDIVTSPYFLKYMIDALVQYRHNTRVASVHGYTPPIKQRLPETFFLRGADCWGWATWRDRWSLFRGDADNLASEIVEQGLVHQFNLLDHYPYLEMLQDRAQGKNNSWAICWHASCFLADRLTLYPGQSLVSNIGLDFSGENCGPSEIMKSSISRQPVIVKPIEPSVSPRVFRIYARHFRVRPQMSKKILSLIKRKLGKFEVIRKFLAPNPPPSQSRLTLLGPFNSYRHAAEASVGYSSPLIVDKVQSALTELIHGNAVYERDGTAFSEQPASLKIAQLLLDNLRSSSSVVDFGGGLGGLYLNHRSFFSGNNSYTVVEQPSFVNAGRAFATKHLLPIQFEASLGDVARSPSILIFSSVLPYLPDPASVIKDALRLSPELIIIDRTAVIRSGKQQWWVQDEPVYYGFPVSYPIQPLNEKLLLGQFAGYRLIDQWINDFDAGFPVHKGFLLKKL